MSRVSSALSVDPSDSAAGSMAANCSHFSWIGIEASLR
jgi:hypothetical protein